jgi:hypothetical protein
MVQLPALYLVPNTRSRKLTRCRLPPFGLMPEKVIVVLTFLQDIQVRI